MADPGEPIQIELTPEQQQLIQRLSGQAAKVLELTPEAPSAPSGGGRGLKFRWRLSVASGVPRLQWGGPTAGHPAGGSTPEG